MAIVVTCRSCGARFHLDEALLKGAKGARIRCRKCGGYIVVRNPAAPPVAPAYDPGPEVPSDVKGAPPAAEPAPAPPATAGKKVSWREEAWVPPPAADAGPNPFGDGTVKEIGKALQVSKASSRRPPYARPLYLVAGLSVLLLAAGALYFGAVKPGQNVPGKGFPNGVSRNPASAKETPVFEVQDVTWFLNKQKTGESLYVIKGTVTNVGKGSSTGIRIEATLLGADNQAILKNGAFAGNLIDENLLPHMSRVRIEGFLGMRYGEGNVNRDIPAGKSLPFMVVFFDPPEQIVSFTVKALEVEEQERIRSPVGKDREPRASNPRAVQPN